MRVVKRLVLVGVMAAAMSVAAFSGPAQANHTWGHCDTVSYHHEGTSISSRWSYACEWWNNWVRWCDRHLDGHRVRAWYYGQFSTEPRITAWAPSGGCLEEGTSYGAGNLTQYRVCVEYEGCTAWRRPY